MASGASNVNDAAGRPDAARGVFYLTLARVVFLGTRLVYFFLLPRFLAGPAEYGNFVLVLGIIMVASTLFLNGTVQAVSKLSAEDPAQADAVRTAALSSGFWLCALFYAGFFFLAGPLAALFKDPALIPLFRAGGFLIAANGLYAVFIGSSNGTGEFGKQALLDSLVAVAKLGLVILLAWKTGTAAGALSGFTLSQWLGVLLGIFLIGMRPWRRGFPLRVLLRYEGTLMLFSLAVDMALRADLFLLKALAPAERSATLAGHYAAAQIFAQVPAILTIAINLVILPVVAAATARGEREKARVQVREHLVMAFVALAWCCALISANAPELIALVYPSEYGAAAPALRILVFGGASYMLFLIATTILTGTGRPRLALVLGAAYLTAIIAAGFFFIPQDPLRGAAKTHLAGGALMATIALLVLWWTLGASLPLRRAAGVALACIASYATAGNLPPLGEVPLPAELLLRGTAQSAVFIAMLLATRTVAPQELRKWLSGVGRRLRKKVDEPPASQ